MIEGTRRALADMPVDNQDDPQEVAVNEALAAEAKRELEQVAATLRQQPS